MCLSRASTAFLLHHLASAHPTKPSKVGWLILAPVLVLAFTVISAPQARAQCSPSPSIVSVTFDPTEYIAHAAQDAHGTVTLSAPRCSDWIFVVTLDPPGPAAGGPFYFTVFGGFPTVTFAIRVYSASQPTVVTATATLGSSSATGSFTVLPFLESVTISPSSIIAQSGQGATATFTFRAPLLQEGQIVMPMSANPTNILYYIPLGVSIYYGMTSFTWGFSAPNPLAGPTNVTLSGTVDGYVVSATVTVLPKGWNPPPSVNPADLGPCKNCLNQAGHPINLTNGNVWIQQRDYSNPGIGGGLELVRTWNSLLQDAGPPPSSPTPRKNLPAS